jgi:hypothetical protein
MTSVLRYEPSSVAYSSRWPEASHLSVPIIH